MCMSIEPSSLGSFCLDTITLIEWIHDAPAALLRTNSFLVNGGFEDHLANGVNLDSEKHHFKDTDGIS